MSFILVGHSSFYLRDGWIKKGVEYIKKNNSEMAFSKKNIDAVDELGIGSVMVQSLKFWLTLLDIIEKKDKKYILKRNIQEIIKKDPYLQNKNVLWLLHSYILERNNKDEIAILWDVAFKSKKITTFNKKELTEQLHIYVSDKELEYSRRSISDSISVFIKMYYTSLDDIKDYENNLYSPFSKLDYLLKKTNDEYYFRNILSEEISIYLVFYLLFKKLESFNVKNIEVREFYNYFDSIIKMKFYEFEKLLSVLEKKDFISIDRAAGLSNIIIKKELLEVEIINRILEDRGN